MSPSAHSPRAGREAEAQKDGRFAQGYAEGEPQSWGWQPHFPPFKPVPEIMLPMGQVPQRHIYRLQGRSLWS